MNKVILIQFSYFVVKMTSPKNISEFLVGLIIWIIVLVNLRLIINVFLYGYIYSLLIIFETLMKLVIYFINSYLWIFDFK